MYLSGREKSGHRPDFHRENGGAFRVRSNFSG
jgi:hypothetical protein